MWRATPALPAFASERSHSRKRWLWLLSTATFCFVVVALGLGLGLRCVSKYRAGSGESHPSQSSTNYGILEHLERIDIDRLINSTQLELRTDFVVSAEPAVRDYVFNITQGLAAPDGYLKPMILVNGQSPGPLIEANVGDRVRVRVNNQLESWSTTIHWHGINQNDSPWMDGVEGVSQCGIPPGEDFTYDFAIDDQRGTFWWHVHLSVQYTDGAYGPLIVHDPDELVPETEEERVLFMSDVYHSHGSMVRLRP